VVGEHRRTSSEAEVTLYRIAQEALRNIHKHSMADKVSIQVEFSQDSVRLQIEDNGVGFNLTKVLSSLAPAGKFGLIGISERVRLLNGRFDIRSGSAKGTVIMVGIPA